MTTTSKTITDLNMRSTPQVSPSNWIESLAPDEPFLAYGNNGRWLRIEHNGRQGFVNGDFTVSLVPEAATALWHTYVTAQQLRLRDAPSMSSNTLVFLPNGTQLAVFGHNEGWMHVQHGALAGFVFSTYTNSDQDGGALADLMSKPKLSTSQINDVRMLISTLSDETRKGDLFEALQAKTIYRSQRDNQIRNANGLVETRAGQMCNLTSLAMCLDYLGIFNPYPHLQQLEDALEHVRVLNSLPPRTTSDGWGGVARLMGANVIFLGTNVSQPQGWYMNTVRPALRAGHAVMMSACGHIVRLQAVTNEGLIIDDPYGRARMLPNAGCSDGRWQYSAWNEYQVPGQTVGEDNLWTWNDVAPHCMRWIAQIARAQPTLGGAPVPMPPMPTFVDDGIVMPGQQD